MDDERAVKQGWAGMTEAGPDDGWLSADALVTITRIEFLEPRFRVGIPS
jgi:hypothetical protein